MTAYLIVECEEHCTQRPTQISFLHYNKAVAKANLMTAERDQDDISYIVVPIKLYV